jgi:hypothetical protein
VTLANTFGSPYISAMTSVRWIGALLVALAVTAVASGATAAELVMYRTAGCPWCARWDRAIGPIYPKTEAGRRAPLRMAHFDQAKAGDMALARPVRYSPTFVLVDGGREIGRIEGYPGEDFFWGLLEGLIQKLPAQAATVGAAPR